MIIQARGFENKRRLVPLSGINTFSDYIEYDNHGFEDGEIIRYSNDGARIGGLDTDQDYYVLKLNDNQFRLASAGIGNYSFRCKITYQINLWFNINWFWRSCIQLSTNYC